MTRALQDDAEFMMRDTTSHPPAYAPGYKTSVLRSPKNALISLQNSLSEVTAPVFGAAELVLHMAVDDDALPDRQAFLGRVHDQVVVERTELGRTEHRCSDFGQRVLQRDQRVLRAAQDAGLVAGRVRRRVRRGVAHHEFGVVL